MLILLSQHHQRLDQPQIQHPVQHHAQLQALMNHLLNQQQNNGGQQNSGGHQSIIQKNIQSIIHTRSHQVHQALQVHPAHLILGGRKIEINKNIIKYKLNLVYY
jgi:hypothetical protein